MEYIPAIKPYISCQLEKHGCMKWGFTQYLEVTTGTLMRFEVISMIWDDIT
jgi:hypothetical protein